MQRVTGAASGSMGIVSRSTRVGAAWDSEAPDERSTSIVPTMTSAPIAPTTIQVSGLRIIADGYEGHAYGGSTAAALPQGFPLLALAAFRHGGSSHILGAEGRDGEILQLASAWSGLLRTAFDEPPGVDVGSPCATHR